MTGRSPLRYQFQSSSSNYNCADNSIWSFSLTAKHWEETVEDNPGFHLLSHKRIQEIISRRMLCGDGRKNIYLSKKQKTPGELTNIRGRYLCVLVARLQTTRVVIFFLASLLPLFVVSLTTITRVAHVGA